jgi:hypothetical protein
MVKIFKDSISKETIHTACDGNHGLVDSASGHQLVSFVKEGQVQRASLNKSFTRPDEDSETRDLLPLMSSAQTII